ncbi:hypothetical protein CTAYLR_003635 [Chrysophaeum taylorii]|uniref:Uncharacterized protein n=1 Tax=Chrysophaeum taylorii TaxID=2483200 RepID=A0AAD7UC65_9STRA|nr:hypothetical protein CTAYLR_003635 [Chrysophaeum taylorii]
MIVCGSEHLIMPRKVFMMFVLGAAGVFGGVVVSNHFYSRRIERFLAAKTKSVKTQNKQLEKEQGEYRDLFNKLTHQIDQDQAGHPPTDRELTKESVVSFHQLATARLSRGLPNDLLEEKEFQLWEKEGLLEYQEERLMNTEDLEREMTAYINTMAATLVSRNQTLPEGLIDQPYFGRHPSADDGPTTIHLRGVSRPRTETIMPHKDGWSP